MNKNLQVFEIQLLTILCIFPFSYDELEFKWMVFFLIAIIIVFFSETKLNFFKKSIYKKCIVPIIFIIIFNFSEGVCFQQKIGFTVPFSWRIPLSTITISLLYIGLIIEAYKGNVILTEYTSFMKIFLFTIFSITLFIVILYPFMYINYNMNLNCDILILNKVMKYIILYVALNYYMEKKDLLKGINISLLVVVGITMLLRISA